MSEELKGQVRRRYAEAALAVRGMGGGDDKTSCCGPSCCGTESQASKSNNEASCCVPSCCSPTSEVSKVDLTGGSYSPEELGELPETAAVASLGCGNPVALATLSPGEVVLDLGSGGGIDVLLSARRVSPRGEGPRLGMNRENRGLARENRRKAGVENAEFLRGEIEDVPLPDGHVDVVISNCVINLSGAKERVVSEAFRVLKPGGRFAVSDVVFLGEKDRLPPGVARSVELWSGCISGALEKDEYESLLSHAGFEEVAVEVTHTYPPEQISGLSGESAEALREVPAASAFIRARKPEAR